MLCDIGRRCPASSARTVLFMFETVLPVRSLKLHVCSTAGAWVDFTTQTRGTYGKMVLANTFSCLGGWYCWSWFALSWEGTRQAQAMHVKSPPTWKRAPTIRSGQEVGASGRAPGLVSCSSSLPSRAQGCKRSRVILMRTSKSSTLIFCSDCDGRCGMISSAPTSQFPRGSSRRVASDEKLGGP